MSILPNFLIIGATKAATTSLASLLETHPEAAIVRGKEPHFFSHTPNYQRGINWYKSLFRHCKFEKAIGDASTSYSRIRQNPHVIQRIQEHLVDVKIIYMVRHPLERIESAFFEHAATASSHLYISINEAVSNNPMLVDSSRYWEVFDAYRKGFGESKVKVVWFEEYIRNQNKSFSDICEFLQIDSNFTPNFENQQKNHRVNTLNRIQKLGRNILNTNLKWDSEIKRKITQELKKDNEKLLDYFKKPLDYWF